MDGNVRVTVHAMSAKGRKNEDAVPSLATLVPRTVKSILSVVFPVL